MNSLSTISRGKKRHLWRFSTDLITAFSNKYVSLLSSGVAFYGMLSIFPALAALISIYGLVSNPQTVEDQINGLRAFLPNEASDLIGQQMQSLVHNAPTKLGVGLVVSALLLLWSARAAASSVMTALNVIYREDETRNFLTQQAVALGLTTGSLMFGAIALSAVAVIPALLQILPLTDHARQLLSLIRWPILSVCVAIGFALMYRYAPCRTHWRWDGLGAGALVATVLWIVASALFSLYVSEFSAYDKTYGSLGAVIVLLMWFYVSAIAFLTGALVDAEIDSEESLRGGALPKRPMRPRNPHPERAGAE